MSFCDIRRSGYKIMRYSIKIITLKYMYLQTLEINQDKMMFFLITIATLAGLVTARQGNSFSDDLLDMVCRLRHKHTANNNDDHYHHKTNYSFTASITAATTNLAPNEVIKFNHVWLNEGKIYNPSTGVFTVPRSGLYMVSASVMALKGKYLHCHMWLNKTQNVGVFGTNYSQGALHAVMRLTKGDELIIKHDNASEGIYGNHWSMFSAYIISE